MSSGVLIFNSENLRQSSRNELIATREKMATKGEPKMQRMLTAIKPQEDSPVKPQEEEKEST